MSAGSAGTYRGFSRYPKDEALELLGYCDCGGCPCGNIEYVPAGMKKNEADVIHLTTGLVVGYPPYPRIKQFREFIETHYQLPVVLGTHSIPFKYLQTHDKLSLWSPAFRKTIAHPLEEDRAVTEAYNFGQSNGGNLQGFFQNPMPYRVSTPRV